MPSGPDRPGCEPREDASPAARLERELGALERELAECPAARLPRRTLRLQRQLLDLDREFDRQLLDLERQTEALCSLDQNFAPDCPEPDCGGKLLRVDASDRPARCQSCGNRYGDPDHEVPRA